MKSLENLIKEVLHIVKEAGEYLLSVLSSEIKVYKKLEIEVFTEADKKCEQILTEKLKKLLPEATIVGEEEFSEKSIIPKGVYWLVDPIDGTVNFIHRMPWFAISVALMQEKEPILGVVYNPVTKEMFYATKGRGAYLNGSQIRVSEEKEIENSLLATSFPGECKKKGFDRCYELFKELNLVSQGVRRFGSAALDLAYVACGRFDGFWEPYLKPWDTAAGMLLVLEAGGKVTDYLGEKYHPFKNNIVASNSLIHEKLISYTSKYINLL